ncbi:acetylornithine transaminase [Aerococcus agrisoli]|uniref:Acetylornithine aminotransferase n=1 Tax=Aerococcus agrisoli TaxID=2487350 RepID=A0A3N4GQE2_9LACT|nr:acetylornithine transaminase [Aerococcus agrisoli]RPA65072.1 acetylornithine transaminase [Aerococcus agrisoli]
MTSEALIALGEQVTMHTFNRADKVMVSGQGTYVTDLEGNKYLDFISGIACNVLGHADPGFVAHLSQQAGKLIHVSNLFWHEPGIHLAEKLVNLSGLDQVFFANSGAEANEAALKLARKWGIETKGPDAYEIISMKQSFHGRTMATLTATGQPALQTGFEPLLPGFSYVAFNDSQALIEAVNPNTAAVIVEVIQGEGGVNQLTPEFIETVNQIQDEANVLVIIDEVQTGIGRTGTMFAYQQTALKPDIISLAKGLGGGYPIGAIVAKKDVANHFQPGDHGTTFGGNPLATAAGNYILDAFEERNLLANVQDKSAYLIEAITKLNHPDVTEIKGQGLLIGIGLTKPVADVVKEASNLGLLVTSSKGNVLRLLPPLNVGKDEIDQAVAILAQVL